MTIRNRDMVKWLDGCDWQSQVKVVDSRGVEVSILELRVGDNDESVMVVDGTVATDLEMEWLLNRAAGE